MTTRDFLCVCRRRWVSILAMLLLATSAAVVVFSLQPTVYASTVKVYVSVAIGSDVTELQQGSSFAEQRATTYADLVSTPVVLTPVIEELELDLRSSELAENLDAVVPPDSAVLELTATASSAQLSADIAEAALDSLRSLVNDLEQVRGEPDALDEPLVELSVVQDAEVPDGPQSPRADQTFGIATASGLLLGIGAALLRESLDSRIREHGDIEQLTTAPVLATTPRLSMRQRDDERETGWRGASAETGYREMRTRMFLNESFGSPSSYVITSSLEGDGKTTVAINLARSLEAGGQRALLIEADLQNPGLDSWLPAGGCGQSGRGLTDVLAGSAQVADVVVTDPRTGLDMITAGLASGTGEGQVDRQKMQDLLESCAESYDVTIIDSPALLRVSDAALLARMATGVLVVVRSGVTTAEQLADSLGLLAQAKARLVGLVLTAVPAGRSRPRPSGRGKD